MYLRLKHYRLFKVQWSLLWTSKRTMSKNLSYLWSRASTKKLPRDSWRHSQLKRCPEPHKVLDFVQHPACQPIFFLTSSDWNVALVSFIEISGIQELPLLCTELSYPGSALEIHQSANTPVASFMKAKKLEGTRTQVCQLSTTLATNIFFFCYRSVSLMSFNRDDSF